MFSILENKAKVLAGKLHGQPFSYTADLRVNSRVVVPNECCVKFDYHDHARNQKVLTVNQLIDYYNHIELPKRTHVLRRNCDGSAVVGSPIRRRLCRAYRLTVSCGGFLLRRLSSRIDSGGSILHKMSHLARWMFI